MPSDKPLHILADRDKLEQVLLNLVTNAIKFTQPGGQITLVCMQDRTAVAVEVRDTGRGIPEDQLTAIFEAFVQVESERTEPTHQGVGLGLAISRQLARAMGGEVTAQSRVGVGSTFTLRLRAALPEPVGQAAAAKIVA